MNEAVEMRAITHTMADEATANSRLGRVQRSQETLSLPSAVTIDTLVDTAIQFVRTLLAFCAHAPFIKF